MAIDLGGGILQLYPGVHYATRSETLHIFPETCLAPVNIVGVPQGEVYKMLRAVVAASLSCGDCGTVRNVDVHFPFAYFGVE